MASIEIKDLDKQKRQLKASFDMWQKTIKETVDKLKEAENEDGTKKYSEEEINKRLELLKDGQQDVIDKWLFLGGTMDELKGVEKTSKPVTKKKSESKTIMEQIAEMEEVSEKPKVKKKDKPQEQEETALSKVTEPSINSRTIPKMDDSNPLASYDIIPLPSKGECYPSKRDRIAVSYLTAMDENIIVSPNLYRDNLVLDIILKEKLRDPEINADDLLDGDRDAIILFLRSSAYGNMYSVSATDPVTKKSFDTKIDLSKIKYKDFTLTGDENGYFDYELPVSKHKIKFKFLSHGEYIKLAKLDEIEVQSIKKKEIDKYNDKLTSYLEEDKTLTSNERGEIKNIVEKLKGWSERLKDNGVEYSHRATNELEMQIMSVDGNTDRKFIHDFITTMPIRDTTLLRRYISENTPGVDYRFEIEKPESLGGGSMSVFLQFDQFIFLTDTE